MFKAVHKDASFEIAAEGSTTGIAALTDGTANIGMSSRRTKPTEVSASGAKGLNLKPTIGIPLMADTAQEILRDSITAFVDGNHELAVEIIARDKSVDAINKQLARELTSFIIENPKTITRALNPMTVAKALERVADHATNIAEEVFYLNRGEDMRHEPSFKQPAPGGEER